MIAYIVSGIDNDSSTILAVFVDDQRAALKFYEKNKHRAFDNGVCIQECKVGVALPTDRSFKAQFGESHGYSEHCYEDALLYAKFIEEQRLED